MVRWISIMAVGLVIGRNAFADPYTDARRATEQGDHTTAISLYELAYARAPSHKSRSSVMVHAVDSASQLLCSRVKELLSATAYENELGLMLRAACKVDTVGPAKAGQCADGRVLMEDKLHCCPVGTYLSPDKLSCLVPTGTLVVHSDLSGVLLTGLPVAAVFDGGPLAGKAFPAKGFYLPEGDVRFAVPVGSYVLKASSMGMTSISRPVTIQVGETREVLEWRPLWQDGPDSFQKFRAGNYTMGSYYPAKGVGWLMLGLGTLAGSAALFGTCGSNINRSCDAVWQQGLSYTGATLGALFGLAFGASAIGILVEKRPAPFTYPRDER